MYVLVRSSRLRQTVDKWQSYPGSIAMQSHSSDHCRCARASSHLVQDSADLYGSAPMQNQSACCNSACSRWWVNNGVHSSSLNISNTRNDMLPVSRSCIFIKSSLIEITFLGFFWFSMYCSYSALISWVFANRVELHSNAVYISLHCSIWTSVIHFSRR